MASVPAQLDTMDFIVVPTVSSTAPQVDQVAQVMDVTNHGVADQELPLTASPVVEAITTGSPLPVPRALGLVISNVARTVISTSSPHEQITGLVLAIPGHARAQAAAPTPTPDPQVEASSQATIPTNGSSVQGEEGENDHIVLASAHYPPLALATIPKGTDCIQYFGPCDAVCSINAQGDWSFTVEHIADLKVHTLHIDRPTISTTLVRTTIIRKLRSELVRFILNGRRDQRYRADITYDDLMHTGIVIAALRQDMVPKLEQEITKLRRQSRFPRKNPVRAGIQQAVLEQHNLMFVQARRSWELTRLDDAGEQGIKVVSKMSLQESTMDQPPNFVELAQVHDHMTQSIRELFVKQMREEFHALFGAIVEYNLGGGGARLNALNKQHSQIWSMVHDEENASDRVCIYCDEARGEHRHTMGPCALRALAWWEL